MNRTLTDSQIDDAVLEALVPGKPTTADVVTRQVHYDTGADVLRDDVIVALRRLHAAHTEGREVLWLGSEWLRPILPGLAATYRIGSDRYAATVIAVSPTAKKATVQLDHATRTDANGMSESQSYTYTRDPKGAVHVFYRGADGAYRDRKRGGSCTFGVRRHYHDFSF